MLMMLQQVMDGGMSAFEIFRDKKLCRNLQSSGSELRLSTRADILSTSRSHKNNVTCILKLYAQHSLSFKILSTAKPESTYRDDLINYHIATGSEIRQLEPRIHSSIALRRDLLHLGVQVNTFSFGLLRLQMEVGGWRRMHGSYPSWGESRCLYLRGDMTEF